MNIASQKPGNSLGGGLMEGVLESSKDVIGVLEVYIHQAIDIQNICIYHKQDVYAKIWLTDDVEKTVSTQTVNGGGRNPVFNENLRLDVRSIESSLKCEVWMLSRVRNYLQDQLLGFVLVPLTDIVIENGKLAKQFTLTSDDMFHSPTGYVQLALAYNGASPEVLEISSTRRSLMVSADEQDKVGLGSVPQEFGMIEFLDPKIANENEMMVTEYYGIPCANLDSGDPKSLDNIMHEEVDVPDPAVESNKVTEVSNAQAPLSSAAINVPPSGPVATTPSACDTPGAPKFVNQDEVSPEEKAKDVAKVSDFVQQNVVSPEENTDAKVSEYVNGEVVSPDEKTKDVAKVSDFVQQDVVSHEENTDAKVSEFVNGDVVSPDEKTGDVVEASDFVNQDVVSPNEKTEDIGEAPVSTVTKPLISVNFEPEQKVVQQDYVDMYMKSMQQFTEALAKMNLPLEVTTELAAPEEKNEKDSANKEQKSKDTGPSPRVFYGSRAFF